MLPAPDSYSLIAALFIGALIALFRVAHAHNVASRIGFGAVALTLAFVAGIAQVNTYFGYNRSWSALATDLSGGPKAEQITLPSATTARDRIVTFSASSPGRSRLLTVRLAGARSGISRQAYVWLPPQYDNPAFAHTQFPVLELLHGYPGRPRDWLTGLRLSTVLNDELAARHIGPMVVVMPAINPAHEPGSQECTDEVAGPLDATYLSEDVPSDIAHHFRVAPPGPSWGIGGFSAGGYCAAMLALRNPASFGAVIDLDGYLHPSEGGFLARRFRGDLAAERAYDVINLLLRDAHGPLPAFDIVTGTEVEADLQDANALAQLLRARETVSFTIERGAGHTFYAWEQALPNALDWAWKNIAPLSLQRAVPTLDPAVPDPEYIPLATGATEPPRRS